MEQVITDDGCALWSRVSGTGSPVVLVHGGPGWWDVFDKLAGMLADDFTVYQWDQRGAGRSDRRGPYTLARFVADLETIRNHTSQEKVHLLGHSWGAILALEYAQAHPDRVDCLLLVSSVGLDGPPPSYRQRVAEILAAEPCEDEWLARISTGFANRSTALSQARRLNTPRFEPNKECAEALLAEVRALPDRITPCGNVTSQTLIIHGAHDLRPPAGTDSLLAALPNAQRAIVPDAAHYPWLEDPEHFRRLTRAFLLRQAAYDATAVE
ncbi:proline iminopeptidase [Kribbella orskensis]|uniref:Proline iminopeptidase n=1 Tax=Kribbella orskensis TaxID=2512216 RepID=A0ABY2BJ16_9ACTN|nr:alpha/beta fold hydrolase [Kribbella sp. VKM Ac-2500]TCN39133.1 proline iminopeptidase [Kribbella sp. VKM Ac-2500]TCO21780.1 proline iminopeptidase [Kribbella orskensis]